MSLSLLTLFAPPEGYTGDFGMLCGFTASRDVVDRIFRTFSGDGSRPRLAAFIHPTAAAVTDVPGVAWMHFTPRPPFKILHAKVALLGFRAPAGYCLRLAVSTGNWTAEPLTTSIDMFWCGDLAQDESDLQLISDIRAADALFRWLREHCNDGLLRQTFDGTRPDASLREAIDALPVSPLPPRFIDTRNDNMRSQIIQRLTGGRKGHLVVGSGFYEASEDTEVEGLLESLRAELIRKKRLSKDAILDLVLNPDSCQGLHAQAVSLKASGWKFRSPGSCYAEHSQAKLHAKYLYLAKHAGSGEIGPAQIYIGSGNFSRMGFESTVPNGNLEAGIVITPDPSLSWRRNARNGIRDVLPGNFEKEVELAALAAGAVFEPPPVPPQPPPVTFVEWADGWITTPFDCDESIEILNCNDKPRSLPYRWREPNQTSSGLLPKLTSSPPAFVTLHPNGWKVPVRADGALVVPRRGQSSLDDILAGIGRFPASTIRANEDENDDDSADWKPPSDAIPNVDDKARSYPIRQMMRLITRLTEAQKELDAREWQRWCRELRQELPGLVETEASMIEPFKAAKANPLRALINAEFLPDGVDVGLLEAALSKIEDVWGLTAAQNLWE